MTETPYTDEELVAVNAYIDNPVTCSFIERGMIGRLLATIAERDARIAELESALVTGFLAGATPPEKGTK